MLRRGTGRVTDCLFEHLRPCFVHALPEGGEVPHAPLHVPLSTPPLPGLGPARSPCSRVRVWRNPGPASGWGWGSPAGGLHGGVTGTAFSEQRAPGLSSQHPI